MVSAAEAGRPTAAAARLHTLMKSRRETWLNGVGDREIIVRLRREIVALTAKSPVKRPRCVPDPEIDGVRAIEAPDFRGETQSRVKVRGNAHDVRSITEGA
jgi:hypothetical protein